MKHNSISLAIVLAAVLFAVPALCQDAATSEAKAPEASKPVSEEKAPQIKELSVYGEVQSVNSEANSIKVQYYDYDTDEEKAMDIIVDKATKLENAASLMNIKQGDWVDVSYTVSDSKNIAKTVSVETEEEIASDTKIAEPPAGTPAEE